jgi:hypothetical protein
MSFNPHKQQQALINLGRGKIFVDVNINKNMSQIDPQLHNGLNKGIVHYPSGTHMLLPPHCNIFRPNHIISSNTYKLF